MQKALLLTAEEFENTLEENFLRLLKEHQANLAKTSKEELLTIEEVSKLLRVTKPTIHKLMKSPKGLAYIKLGKSTRFKQSEVLKYLESNKYNK